MALNAAMSVRVARPEDAEAIARIHVASWQHAYRGTLPDAYLDALSIDSRRAMWADSIATDRATVLLAQADDAIAGFSAVGPCRDMDAADGDREIWAIYVAPAHWAQGAGRALWHASRAHAEQRGAARLSLWVFTDNVRARRFYEKMALSPEPASLKTFELGGVTLQEIRYVFRLRDDCVGTT